MKGLTMIKQAKQAKGFFKSLQSVASATSTMLRAGTELAANEVLLAKSKNMVENIPDFDESKFDGLDGYDAKLDAVEAELENDNLSPRRRARLERRLAMMETSANTIENLKLEVVG